MEDYQKHVTNTRQSELTGHRVSYCRIQLTDQDQAFLNVDHVINTLEMGGLSMPCPKCKNKIIELLNNAYKQF